MPYNFIKEGRAAGSRDDNEDNEAKIQDELNAWRLTMREERRRRLHAAAAVSAERGQERRRANLSVPHDVPSPLIHREDHKGTRNGKEVTPLQEYRRELSEVASKLCNGKNAHWFSGMPTPQYRRTKQIKNVTYYRAQSVLRDYIRRPTQPSPKLVKTSIGTLQAYKDALAVSARVCSSASVTPSLWHERPLRSISANTCSNRAMKDVSVATTRSTTLRKKHIEQSCVRRNCAGFSKMGLSRAPQNECKGRSLRTPCSVLEPTETYRNAMLQHELQPPSREVSLGRGKTSTRSCLSSPCSSQQGSITQSIMTSPPDLRLSQQLCCLSYAGPEAEPAILEQTPKGFTPTAEVVVSPLTPASEKRDNVHQNEKQPRRAPVPLLAELLSKLALPTPLHNRPDLYQGRTRSNTSPVA